MKVSICSLIYKSIPYLKFVKRGIEKNTSKEINWELVFIANDATKEVLDYLKKKEINHIIHSNPDPNEYWINRVYTAWNRAKEVEGEIIILLNSDMWVAKGWLTNLLKNLIEDENRVVTSLLVESGKIPSILPYTVVQDFGRTPETFREEEFEQFAESIKRDEIKPLGTFMPMAIYKKFFVESGGYPQGNVQGISGDQIFFYEILKNLGLKHFTAFDSICYHIQLGEKDG